MTSRKKTAIARAEQRRAYDPRTERTSQQDDVTLVSYVGEALRAAGLAISDREALAILAALTPADEAVAELFGRIKNARGAALSRSRGGRR